MTITRQIIESPIVQGVDEQIAYTLTTTPWGSTPSNVAVVLKNSLGVDVTATNLSGAASVNGDVITLPKIISLAAGAAYRLEVKFTSGGNVFECYADVYGQE